MSWVGLIYCGLVAYICFWVGVHSERNKKNEVIKNTSTNKQRVEMPCPSQLFPEWRIMDSNWQRGAHAMHLALEKAIVFLNGIE